MMFLGGRSDGAFQIFCEEGSAKVLHDADYLFMDGSWGSTPLISMRSKRRNWWRMEWTLNSGFFGHGVAQTPHVVKSAVILFRMDKPSCGTQEVVRLLIMFVPTPFAIECICYAIAPCD
eukprot:550728_1